MLARIRKMYLLPTIFTLIACHAENKLNQPHSDGTNLSKSLRTIPSTKPSLSPFAPSPASIGTDVSDHSQSSVGRSPSESESVDSALSSEQKAYDMNIRVDAETELRYRYSMTEDLGAMQLTNGIKTMRETREQYLIRFFPTIEGKITIDSKIETSDTIYYDLVNGQRQNERKSFSQSDERAFAVVRQNTTPMAEPTTITIGTGTSNSDPPSRHFRAIIKSNGELVSIENEIDLYRQIFGEKVAQMAALPEDNFSRISYMSDYEPLLEEFVSQHFRPFFSMYPLQSVRAGESWITRKPVLTRTSYQLHGYSFKSRVQPMWMLKEIGQNLKLSYLSEWDVYPPNAVAKQIMKEDGYALLDPKTSLLKELKINMLTKTGAGKESSLVPSLTFEVQQL